MEAAPTAHPEKPNACKAPQAEAIVRPELNLEKWPAIWEPAKSRRAFRTRVIEREITLSDGNTVTARVRVAPSTEGTLTTEEQRHLYGLIHLWEDGGRRVEEATHFSLQRLAKVLKKGWGQRTIETMVQSLTRLLATTIFWENAYYDKATGETKKELHGFHILEELYIAQASKDGRVTREACFFRFNGFILANLLANYTKPVLLDTVLGFQSDVAQILYTHLDLILSGKDHYRRRSRELFAELGLTGPAYQNASDRRRTLERALKELQGVPLTTGHIAHIATEKTVDGKDHNLVVRKGRGRPPASRDASPPDPGETPAPPPTPHPGAAEQVRHFYEVFHRSGATAVPSPKELAQAQDHLDRLGAEAARHLVDFAALEAPKTKFSIQTYGGVLRYEARAMRNLEQRREAERGQARQRDAAALEKARKAHEERFQGAYRDYLRETLARTEIDRPEAFVAFLDQDEVERGKYARQKLTVYLRQHFDTEEARLARFAEFFRGHADAPVLDFWGWDAAYNPERFDRDMR